MSRTRFIALLLAFVTLLVYLPVGWHQFVNYDDTEYIVENAFVKSGLSLANLRWAFTSFHSGNWHPLTWISHQLDCELFGLNPGAQHLINALFHAANVTLLFIFLLRLKNAASFWPCAIIAALFAWHPLHVESVAWLAERKDLLSTFFGLLALTSYVAYAREKTGQPHLAGETRKSGLTLLPFNSRATSRHYAFTLLFFALSLLAKPMLVTLPCLLFLLDFWPLARWQGSTIGKLLTEKIPFFLLSFASCWVTILAQKNGDAVASLVQVPLSYRLENTPVSLVRYLGNLFWPANLNVIYLLDRIQPWQVIVSSALLLLISALAWRGRKTRPYFLFGWLWFLGTLMPVIGLVQVGSQSIADRYTYIPSIGFFTVIVFLCVDFAAKISPPKISTTIVTTVILFACIGLTEYQLRFWQNSETLFQRAIAVRPDNVVALVNLATVLDTQSRFDEALAVYRRAEKYATGSYYQLHKNLGDLLARLGQQAEALAEYHIAIAERPNDTEPHLAAAKVLLQLGRDPEAVNELRAAVQTDPKNFQLLAYTAHVLAANANAAARDGRTALGLAVEANHLSGHTQPMVFDAMGMACAELGDFTNAQACAETAIKLADSYHMQDTEILHRRLAAYQKNLPWREFFHDTNAPITPASESN